MPKTRSVTFQVRIAQPRYGQGDMPGFLDMLRYEGGRVQSWSTDASTPAEAYLVLITVDDHYRHQPARWLSFGIRPSYDVKQQQGGISEGERQSFSMGVQR